jgi:hypothetical protein
MLPARSRFGRFNATRSYASATIRHRAAGSKPHLLPPYDLRKDVQPTLRFWKAIHRLSRTFRRGGHSPTRRILGLFLANASGKPLCFSEFSYDRPHVNTLSAGRVVYVIKRLPDCAHNCKFISHRSCVRRFAIITPEVETWRSPVRARSGRNTYAAMTASGEWLCVEPLSEFSKLGGGGRVRELSRVPTGKVRLLEENFFIRFPSAFSSFKPHNSSQLTPCDRITCQNKRHAPHPRSRHLLELQFEYRALSIP